MTNTSKGGTPGVYSYAPGVAAKPIRFRLNGKWVGFGASIKMIPPPPRLPYIVPEVTQAELSELFENPAFKSKIVFTPSAAKNVSSISKPDTGSAEGPEEDN